MSRKLRVAKPRQELTLLQRQGLLTGDYWSASEELTGEAEREAWMANRDELLGYWLQDAAEWARAGGKSDWGYPEPGGPFTRPAAWWKYESREPRKRIGGEGIAAIDSDACPDWAAKLSFGHPTVWDDDYGDEVESWYETERDYLIRLKLLTPAEKQILAKEHEEAKIQ
jgi:hypothetical protein